jgi:hypothetical protein
MSEETPKKRGRPKKPKAKGRPKSAPVFDENGIELSKRQIQKLELDQKKIDAKLAYEARKERAKEEAALTPVEKEALKLLREEERLKQAEIKANEQARKDTIRNEKVSMEMARIKAEETRQKLEEKPISLTQLTKLFFKPCDTRADLKAWIKYFLGLDLPDYTVSRYADSNPLDIIWEIYRICVHKKNPENVEELLVVAGRGSGKCQIKGTKILTKEGVRDIEDIKAGDTVYTGWGWDNVKTTFDEGVKDSITIKTQLLTKESPFENTGSPHHRIQAIQKDGSVDWTYLSDIKVGDYIYKSAHNDHKIDTNTKDYIDGWLLGVILGDGAINRHNCNEIALCSSDFDLLRFYADEIYMRFGIKQRVKRNSKKSVNLKVSSKEFKTWVNSYIDGELSYDKKLKTLNHSYEFLAGVFSGLMDTDGSKDSITLANRDLTQQIGQILNIFGVAAAINNNRREARFSQFTQKEETYHECLYKTKLPNVLLPKFAKRDAFISYRESMNEQFRFPNEVVAPFARFIKEELCASNGWITLNGERLRIAVPYAKELYGKLNKTNNYIYGYKLHELVSFFKSIGCTLQATQLEHVCNGYYEKVVSVRKDTAYFYDLEMENIHSYWSNGFISHNTLSVAIAEFLLLFHDQRDVAHVGAILSQAKRCYEYQVGFLLSDKVKQILNQEINTKPMIEKMTQEKSLFNVRDRFTGETIRVGLEVLPCTLKAVNGAHVAFVSVDEIDTISGEGARALQDVSGMLDSKRGRKSLRVGISTRKSRYGIMNRQIEEAEKAGRTVRKWTILEFSERCDDARSGRIPTDAYINQDTLEVLLPKEFEKLDKRKKGEFELNHFPGDRCIVCPLAALCRGDAKQQKSTSTMLKPISDAIKKTRENGPDWAISQLFNLKPSVEGIIFKEFDDKVHVQDWNGMWEILTGTSYPGVCTHDVFVKKCHSMNLPSYGGVDFGWSSPAAYVVCFIDNRENVFVVRTEARTYTSNPNWIQTIKMKWHPLYRSQLYFPDCANPGDVQMFRQEGLPVPTNQVKDIAGGIQVIKKWLRSLASPTPKFYVAKETNAFLIEEFKLYHFKTDAAGVITDDPEDENNHAIDALRYIMYGLFSKSRSVMSSSDSEFDVDSVMTENGFLKRAPSAVEFAAIHNIPINTEVFDPKSMGKMVRASEMAIQTEENDEGVGGSGSFLFSF